MPNVQFLIWLTIDVWVVMVSPVPAYNRYIVNCIVPRRKYVSNYEIAGACLVIFGCDLLDLGFATTGSVSDRFD